MQQFEAIWSLQQAVEQSTFSAVFACQFEFDLALTHARSCLSVYTDILTYTYTHTHTNASWCLCKQLHFGSLIKILLKLQLQHQHKLQIYACSLRSALASSAPGPASSPIPSPAWSHAMQMAARQTCCCLSLSLSVSLNFLFETFVAWESHHPKKSIKALTVLVFENVISSALWNTPHIKLIHTESFISSFAIEGKPQEFTYLISKIDS